MNSKFRRTELNTRLSSVCVTDQTSEVKTATKSPENSVSFPGKKIEFGRKTSKLYWRKHGTSSAKIPPNAK